VRLHLLVRLFRFLSQALLEEGGSDWALLNLGLGRRDGGGLRYRCWSWSRSRSGGWLNGLCRRLYWWFHLHGGGGMFWLW
jgi:hypothetical protein